MTEMPVYIIHACRVNSVDSAHCNRACSYAITGLYQCILVCGGVSTP